MKRFAYALLLTSLLSATISCVPTDTEPADAPDAAKEALPAHVITTTTRKIVDYEELTGRTAAVESVNVLAQVSGYLETINFTPGSFVHKGDVLFTLDSRLYKATLDAAVADAAAKRADLERLEAEFARQQSLIEKNATSRQQLELAIAERDQRKAELEAALATAELAKINLDYATIHSPIDGETSREQITVGNLVSEGSTLLTKVVAVDPLYVYFDVDERTLLAFREQIENIDVTQKTLSVKFGIGDGEVDREAKVDFTEPQINPTTGTLEFRSIAENPVGENGLRPLIPGLRVRVLFPTSLEYDGVMVPEEAIVTDQTLKRVYVLNDDNTVDFRQVTLGALQEDNMRVIKEGLEPGERVVVDNLLRIQFDSVIEPMEIEAKSLTQIVREDGTIIHADGTTTTDDIYSWSLTR